MFNIFYIGLKSKLDYIHFIYGVNFIMLSAMCFLVLSKEKRHKLPWLYLGIFGVGYGLTQWLDLIFSGIGFNQLFRIIHAAVIISSFMALVISWRFILRELSKNAVHRFAFEGLLVAAFLVGLEYSPSGIGLFYRYFFGFLSGLCAALFIFIQELRKENPDTYFKIAEKRQTEEKISKLLVGIEQSPAAVVITDIKGNIEYVNPKFVQLTGYTFREAIGKNPRILKSGEQPQAFYKEMWDSITSGKDWHGEFHNRKKNGEFYWEFASISPVRNKDGEITNYIAVKEDVTERKNLDQMKQDFVNTVAHEVRAPLAIVKEGVSQLLEGLHGAVSDEQKKFLSMSVESVNRISRIVEGLLRIAKMEAKKVEINKQTFDLAALATETANGLSLFLSDKGLELKLNFSSPRLEVFADKDQIADLLVNLINNACKFTDKGYIEVFVADRGAMVECGVRDTGIGIDKDSLPKLFSKFQQLGQAGAQKKGVGLGLAICKGIVELHGGKIWAESELGKGTKIIFTLPKK